MKVDGRIAAERTALAQRPIPVKLYCVDSTITLSPSHASSTRNGLIFGLILVASLINVTFGLPALLAWMLVRSGALSLRRSDVLIVVLLIAKIAWVAGIYAVFKSQSVFVLLQTLAVDLILLAAFVAPQSEGFLRGMAKPLAALFLVDFLFNLSSLVLGADPLGRAPGSRPDDIIPRLGGVFYHPFYSINISLMAILFAAIRRWRFIFLLAVANILLNGSFRGWVTLAIGVLVMTLLWLRLGRWKFVIVCLLAAASVFAVTIYSAKAAGELTGNFFRVYAWVTALDKIATSPWIGTHTFATGELPGISEEIIAEFGIAESTYLGYAMHFGLFPMFAHMGILLSVLLRCLSQLRRAPGPLEWLAALFAGVIFVDTFYGTVLGSVLTTTCFALLCVSYRPANPSMRLRRSSTVRIGPHPQT